MHAFVPKQLLAARIACMNHGIKKIHEKKLRRTIKLKYNRMSIHLLRGFFFQKEILNEEIFLTQFEIYANSIYLRFDQRWFNFFLISWYHARYAVRSRENLIKNFIAFEYSFLKKYFYFYRLIKKKWHYSSSNVINTKCIWMGKFFYR